MKHPTDQPYYSSHKILDWTCPYCKGRLTHMVNETLWANYRCECGKWTQFAQWGIPDAKKAQWEYKKRELWFGRAR